MLWSYINIGGFMAENITYDFKIGDEVYIKKELNPIIYIIKKITDNKVLLIGKNYRVMKKADVGDIQKAALEMIERENQTIKN